MPSPERRPTARDLAGSAADLRGYAVMFRSLAAGGDERGRVEVPATTLARAADFFDAVVDEMLGLIEPVPVRPPEP